MSRAVRRVPATTDEACASRILGPAAVTRAARPALHRARHEDGAGAARGRAATLWPPERDAAVRLAHAHRTLDQLTRAADPRLRALGHRQVDAAEAAARTLLDRPPDTTNATAGHRDVAAHAAQERGRAALAQMLGNDPGEHAAAVTDVTQTWPAEHLAALRHWAEHANQSRPDRPGVADQDVAVRDGQDAVSAARAAVDAVPTAAQPADEDDSLRDQPGRDVDTYSDVDTMSDTAGRDSW